MALTSLHTPRGQPGRIRIITSLLRLAALTAAQKKSELSLQNAQGPTGSRLEYGVDLGLKVTRARKKESGTFGTMKAGRLQVECRRRTKNGLLGDLIKRNEVCQKANDIGNVVDGLSHRESSVAECG
ncbi:hypothetical protein J3F84DRAFT_390426 [Trichoderma pleuroticola]